MFESLRERALRLSEAFSNEREKEIFIKCIDSGMKYDDTISQSCWRKVQKFRKEYELAQMEEE